MTEHEAAVLAGWKRLAAEARAADMTELADSAQHHADLLENPPTLETPK